jgi:hypothetical protein
MTNTTGPSKAAIVNAWRVIMREAARVRAERETQKEQAA